MSDNEIKEQTKTCHDRGFQAWFGQEQGVKLVVFCAITASRLQDFMKPTGKCYKMPDRYDVTYPMQEIPCDSKNPKADQTTP